MPQIQPTEPSKVLTFRPTRKWLEREARPLADERGTLLLFTGVRYERMLTDLHPAISCSVATALAGDEGAARA